REAAGGARAGRGEARRHDREAPRVNASAPLASHGRLSRKFVRRVPPSILLTENHPMLRPVRSLALVGLFLGSGALLARADEPGKATTPKACIQGMIDCAKKNDMDGLSAYMIEP